MRLEQKLPFVREITDLGRTVHRRWVERIFIPLLERKPNKQALVLLAKDVQTWKMLRRDAGLPRSQAVKCMCAMARMAIQQPKE